MKSVIIQFKLTCHVGQADSTIFPATVGKGEDSRDFERSCEGSIHYGPGQSKTVTQDEFDVMSKDKTLRGLFVVLHKDSDAIHAVGAPESPAVLPASPSAPNADEEATPALPAEAKPKARARPAP